MRDLVLLRGCPGSGKSTWLRNNNLSQYALCADDLRCMFQTPVMDHQTGRLTISQKNDKAVWKLLFELLETRMSRGEFTIIDACHSKASDFSKYYHLAEEYRYRLHCVDFSDVPLETALKQNKMRPSYKWVPEDVIRNIYARFEANPIPNKINRVTPDNWQSIIDYKPLTVDNYKKVVLFGDIHSCYMPLEKYINDNPINDDTLYVFVGDYFDRGIQTKEVCEFLLKYSQNKNFMFLQGNHEQWLMKYAHNKEDEIKSSEFMNNTKHVLDQFDKKDLRIFCRKLIQCAYLEFRGKKLFITHAGFGFMPEQLKFIATSEMIKNGKYEDNIDEWFEENNSDPDLIQIHGHRNFYQTEIQKYPHSINLCDKVEFGGNFRILELE